MNHLLKRLDQTTSRRALIIGAAGAIATASDIKSTAAATEAIENIPIPIADPSTYMAYVPTASKTGQFFWYTCEFDAAWAIFKTFGIDVGLEEQLELIGIDDRIEPWYEETVDGFIVHGGDIWTSWSGDYVHSLLARTKGEAMRKVFRGLGLQVGRVRSRRGIRHYLDMGRPVWIKTTVDFLDWRPAIWITPEGNSYPVPLTNDHAAIVIGYNDDVVVIRDVLGPTDTNWNRAYEYEVDWQTFARCWAASGKDGLAIGPKS